MKKDTVVESVIADLKARSEKGILKYGTTLDRDDLSLKDWLQHAYEETLDKANYLKAAINRIQKDDDEMIEMFNKIQMRLNFDEGEE